MVKFPRIKAFFAIGFTTNDMKILIISTTPWSADNSFGNSYDNIFQGFEDIEFANICCSSGKTSSENNIRCFQISEKSLLKNLRNPKFPSGKEISKTESFQPMNEKEKGALNKAKKLRWQILFWARDFIWRIGRWKSKELLDFIDDFKPDIIFQPIYYFSFVNRIILYIHKRLNIPMIGYVSDDIYTLKQWHFSPLYWIDRLIQRRNVKKVINSCEILYVISEIQRKEYQALFKPECKILTKMADFDGEMPTYQKDHKGLTMVYAGNVSSGRWKSLSYIVDAVSKLRKEGYDISLEIYSGTPLTKKMERSLTGEGTSLLPPVPYEEIVDIQKKSDVLIHAEGLSKKSRLTVRHSFSTKLVDYFSMAKCTFAVGKDDVASIMHLIDNNAAIVAQSKKEVYEKLKNLLDHPEDADKYGKLAWECGKNHHNKKEMHAMLETDLKRFSQKE